MDATILSKHDKFRAKKFSISGELTKHFGRNDSDFGRLDHKPQGQVLGRCPSYMELSLYGELTAHQNNTYFFQSEICPVAQTVVHLLMM